MSGTRAFKDFRLQLVLVALFGLAIRVVAVVRWSRYLDPQGDQNFYWRQGQDLASGYGFVYRNNFGERVATAVHPPLYSAYLGVVSWFGGTSHAWHRMASTLLGFGAVVVIGYVGRHIGGTRVGLIAAFLAAIYPNLWLNDAMMLSESLYALVIGLVLLTAFRFRDDATFPNAIMLGAAIAFAALTRAEAVFLFLLLAVPLLFVLGDLTWRRRLERGAVVLAAGAVVLAPWMIRNYLTFETHPITISNGSGFVVEISNCDQTYGLAAPTDGAGNPLPDEAADKLLGYWAQECDRTPWPAGDETVVAAAKQRAGVDYITEHKKRFPLVVAARIGRIWDVWRPAQSNQFNEFYERRNASLTVGGADLSWNAIGMVQYFVMLPLACGALVVLWRRKVTIIPFVAVFVMTTLTAAVSFGITRYRVGADVAIAVLAAVAIDAIVRRFLPTGATPTTDTQSSGPDGDPDDTLVGVGDRQP